MFTAGVLTTLYLAIATLAAAMTYCEQRRDKNRTTFYNLLGFVACAVWPLTLALSVLASLIPVKNSLQAPTGA